MERIILNNINIYQCDPGFQTEKRVLDTHYFLYVHKGTGRFKIGTEWYDGKIGDLFYCPMRVGNAISADQADPFLLSGIEFTVPDGKQDLELPPVMNLTGDGFLQSLILEMAREYSYGKTDSPVLCSCMLTVLIQRVRRDGQAKNGDTGSVSGKLLEYILNNYNRPLSHRELAEVFSYHKNSINRMLLKETGMTLKNYLIDIRVKKACEFLRYSDKTVTEIAELCGYSSSVYFSRQFHQKTGTTPLNYRNNR